MAINTYIINLNVSFTYLIINERKWLPGNMLECAIPRRMKENDVYRKVQKGVRSRVQYQSMPRGVRLHAKVIQLFYRLKSINLLKQYYFLMLFYKLNYMNCSRFKMMYCS